MTELELAQANKIKDKLQAAKSDKGFLISLKNRNDATDIVTLKVGAAQIYYLAPFFLDEIVLKLDKYLELLDKDIATFEKELADFKTQ